MASALEARLLAFRRAVLARDEATLRAIAAAFDRVVGVLEAEIAALARHLAEEGLLGGGLGDRAARGRLLRLERYRVLLRQADDELARLLPAAERAIRMEQLALVRIGPAQAESLVAASLGRTGHVVAGFARLPVGAVTDLVGLTQAGTPLRAALLRYGPAAADAITDALVEGMARGTHPTAVARLARDRLVALGGGTTSAGVPRLGSLEGLARTSMLTAYRTSTLRTYVENDDIVDGWTWTAAKQSRTCAACLALDGRTFPLSVEFMRAHPQCRCAPRPSTKGAAGPEVESGTDWFARQDPATQDRIVGKSGGAAIRAGEVALGDFVRLDRSEVWGEMYRADSVSGARARAAGHGRRAA